MLRKAHFYPHLLKTSPSLAKSKSSLLCKGGLGRFFKTPSIPLFKGGGLFNPKNAVAFFGFNPSTLMGEKISVVFHKYLYNSPSLTLRIVGKDELSNRGYYQNNAQEV